MIISIGGHAGSGKSTIAKKLAKTLNYNHYYIGGMRREIARKHNMSLQELNIRGESEPWTDEEVDIYQKNLGKTEDNFVIEGRTSFLFIPHSVKLFFSVEEIVGARRIWQSLQKKEDRNEASNLDSVEAVLKSTKERKKSDIKRYKKYYNIDVYDRNHYDLAIDTTYLAIDEVYHRVYDYVRRRLESQY